MAAILKVNTKSKRNLYYKLQIVINKIKIFYIYSLKLKRQFLK